VIQAVLQDTWVPHNRYLAPEVMCKMDHSIMVDYYALGVITYEMMLGRRPYNGRSRQEIRE
jgi:serine/threonine protein kinase